MKTIYYHTCDTCDPRSMTIYAGIRPLASEALLTRLGRLITGFIVITSLIFTFGMVALWLTR